MTMAIKYEYNSTCCSHFYVETRNESDAQVMTKCNVCGQGEYELTAETILEEINLPDEAKSEDLPVE